MTFFLYNISETRSITGRYANEIIQNLYRHLRAVETKTRSQPASPASSGFLPTATSTSSTPNPKSNVNGDTTRNGKSRTRSRSNSTSSSSSERTARPNTSNGHSLHPTTNGDGNGHRNLNGNGFDRKGKGKSTNTTVEEVESRSESSVPSKIYVNHPKPITPSSSKRSSSFSTGNAFMVSMLASLHRGIQSRLVTLSSRSDWIASTIAIPLPILFLVFTFIAIRRRLARRRGSETPFAVAGTAGLANHAMEDIRARLLRIRVRGIVPWMIWWFRWWLEKFVGVWRLGTTITYV